MGPSVAMKNTFEGVDISMPESGTEVSAARVDAAAMAGGYAKVRLKVASLYTSFATLIIHHFKPHLTKRTRLQRLSILCTTLQFEIDAMASQHRASTPDERAPLLAHEDVRHGTGAPSEENESSTEPQKASSKTWEYVWKGCLFVFAVLVVAVFVKGWIDADDVNVSVPKLSAYGNRELNTQRMAV